MPGLGTNLSAAVSRFGASVKQKMMSPGAKGSPESQIRGPFEILLNEVAESLSYRANDIVAIGEVSLTEKKMRPDYAIVCKGMLVGYVEIKAPGKGSVPAKFSSEHDQKQWEKFKKLPNVLYTDGNSFSLWRSGKLFGDVVQLIGDVQSSGKLLTEPGTLSALFGEFFSWEPIPPKNVRELAEISAQLCRLLRDEVIEHVQAGGDDYAGLAEDWKIFLFPEAKDEQFADGYAQSIIFGLLLAKINNMSLSDGLHQIANSLSKTSSIISGAFRILTGDGVEQDNLKTSLGTAVRVLDVVDWTKISKKEDADWLYFYENFLIEYDKKLRRQTGSYYTPPSVVTSMTRLVDDALRDVTRFNVPRGLASPEVTVADPAMGTGAFLLAVLKKVAENVRAEQGPGAVSGVVNDAVSRLIGFEIQLGPFAVAQLRILAELMSLTQESHPLNSPAKLRLHVTDTLGNPESENGYIPTFLKPLAESRRQADKVKREEAITIVIGNPPYKDKSKGKGGWVEEGGVGVEAPLQRWIPPREWKLGAHTKHLRNLYIYFWRWATWKVFGDGPLAPQACASRKGIVSFVSASGFINGPGFAAMRKDLREKADEIFVINCTPEGMQPPINSRIFQGVQQPICIVMVIATGHKNKREPARVRYQCLPEGERDTKFGALEKISLNDRNWLDCPTEWQESFLPKSIGRWAKFPKLDSLFEDSSSGVMPGRTWIIAPDQRTLRERWARLQKENNFEKKKRLFHPHMRNGVPGDRHLEKEVKNGLPGHEHRSLSVAHDKQNLIQPIRYGVRTFDRQWIIPDNRLINQPNPGLWERHSSRQFYLTALKSTAPKSGPALSFTSLIPDLAHFKGSEGGRVYSLYVDAEGDRSNIKKYVTDMLTLHYGFDVSGDDVMAYIAAVAAHPKFLQKYGRDLQQPGLRIPFTADAKVFSEAVSIGLRVINLHTFGERGLNLDEFFLRKYGMSEEKRVPNIPKGGSISYDEASMPDAISYDGEKEVISIGSGVIENVSSAVWNYEVSGRKVLRQWFDQRKKNRTKATIGDRRPSSELNGIWSSSWLSEYTTELLELIRVIDNLTRLEPKQRNLLISISDGPLCDLSDIDNVSDKRNLRPLEITDSYDENLVDNIGGKKPMHGVEQLGSEELKTRSKAVKRHLQKGSNEKRRITKKGVAAKKPRSKKDT